MGDQEKLQTVRLAGRKNVNAALELLRERANRTGKRKRNVDREDKSNNVAANCANHLRHSHFYREKTNAALGFSENYALTEMRNCLMRNDWAGLRQLFPLIVGCYSKLEPVIWRYLLTILVCSPERDSSHFRQFLETCVGIQGPLVEEILQGLLSSPDNDT